MSCLVSFISSLNACLPTRGVCVLILKSDYWLSLALMHSGENKQTSCWSLFQSIECCIYNLSGWKSPLFFSLPLPLLIFIFCIHCHVGSGESMQMSWCSTYSSIQQGSSSLIRCALCWFPLLVTDTEKRTAIFLCICDLVISLHCMSIIRTTCLILESYAIFIMMKLVQYGLFWIRHGVRLPCSFPVS